METSLKYFQSYMSISSSPERPRLAFLGPLGTYSHQAAYECFGNSVEYLARPTIADVQRTLSTTVPFGIIPQENSINGSVVETYDVLRVPAVGQETFVRGVTVFAVKHTLVARRGVKLEEIKKVLSHEQALGQCREWLAKHLPQASLVSTDSTADAAKRLLLVQDKMDPMECAAICSSVVVTLYEGLEILAENIQDRMENFTRFYILSQGQDVALPEGHPLSTESMALLRLRDPSNPAKSISNIPRVISTLDMTVKRIDRRPTIDGRPFDNVYFLEVGAVPGQDSLERCDGQERRAGTTECHTGCSSRPSGELSWIRQLRQAVDRLRCTGVEVSVVGWW